MWRTKWVPKHFGDTDAPPLWDWGGVDPLETSFDAKCATVPNFVVLCQRVWAYVWGVPEIWGPWCPAPPLGTGSVTVLLEHTPAPNILSYQISSL